MAVAAVAASTAVIGGLAGPALAQSASAPKASGVSSHDAAGLGGAHSAASITSYWTRSRMLSAKNGNTVIAKAGSPGPASRLPSGPAGRIAGAKSTQALGGSLRHGPAAGRDGLAPAPGSAKVTWPGYHYAPPATTTGVLFFSTTAGGVRNWYCSASTVNSNGKDVVFTAGQCVYGNLGGAVPGETWHANEVFVPDYTNGAAPYGAWSARQLWTLTNWVNYQDLGDDMGALVMNTNGYGQHIVNVVGGQGMAWNFPANLYVYDFGYPGTGILQYCSGYEFNWSAYVPSTIGLACPFGTATGGPWLAYFNGTLGYLNGVNAFWYTSLPSYVFSPYFGTNAGNLYNAVANL